MIIKLSLKLDVSVCKLMLGVVGLSATVGAVYYFAKNKNEMSDGKSHVDNVSKKDKSSTSHQIRSP